MAVDQKEVDDDGVSDCGGDDDVGFQDELDCAHRVEVVWAGTKLGAVCDAS